MSEIEDFELLLLLVNKLERYKYDEIQTKVRTLKEIGVPFKKYFVHLSDTEMHQGVLISRQLNYDLNVMEWANLVKYIGNSLYRISQRGKEESAKIKEKVFPESNLSF